MAAMKLLILSCYHEHNMVEKIPHDNSPFVPALEPDIFKDPDRNRAQRLQGVEGREDLVVRVDQVYPKSRLSKEQLTNARQAHRQNPNDTKKLGAYHEELDRAYDIPEMTQYRAYLKQLERCGIKHSGFYPVIGADQTGLSTKKYAVTDRINGIPAEDSLDNIPEEAAISTFKKIIANYKLLVTEGGLYDFDLGLDQFVYDPNTHDMILIDHTPSYVEPVRPNVMSLAHEWRRKLYDDLIWLETSYDNKYPDIKQAIDEIAAPKQS